MADIDLKTLTPDTSIADSAVLFGADSQASTTPSVYSVSTLRTHIVGTANTFTQPQVVSVGSSSDALRITQTGAGNALVVEDEANPDSTPFVVTAAGNVGVGTSAPSTPLTVKSRSADNVGVRLLTSPGNVGAILQFTDDPVTAEYGSLIATPTYLLANSSTEFRIQNSGFERMRITSAGNIGVGGTPSAGRNFALSTQITGSTLSRAYTSIGTIQPDVTTTASYFASSASTAAASFTIGNILHYTAIQGAFGAGSTVASQIGFSAESSLIGATNNFGFYGDIAAGTGRWNFYANGTANNYFAGNVGIGTSLPGAKLEVTAATYCPIQVVSGSVQTQFAANAGGALDIRAVSDHPILFYTNNQERMRIDTSGNLLLGTTASPTTGTQSLTVETGTAPTATPADTISLYSSDLSAGNTILSLFTEGTPVNANTTAAATHRIAVRINGTVYYLLANTAA